MKQQQQNKQQQNHNIETNKQQQVINTTNNEIEEDWDPGPTFVVQRLWDPGGPSYTSRSSLPMDRENLGQEKSYLDNIHLPGLSSQPIKMGCCNTNKKSLIVTTINPIWRSHLYIMVHNFKFSLALKARKTSSLHTILF